MKPHPIHPVLVHFPVACWSLGSVTDIARLFFGGGVAEVSSWLISAGLILSIPAMLTGLLDLGNTKNNSAAQDTVITHVSFVLITWTFYAASVFMRTQAMTSAQFISLALSIGGLVCLGFAGWYGGKLVYSHGIGVQIKELSEDRHRRDTQNLPQVK